MSRRPSAPPVGRINTARARMAPGGRMWSESPIRAPRRRVAMAGVGGTGVPPEAGVMYRGGPGVVSNPATGVDGTLPAFPEGLTSAVALIGSSAYTGLTIPEGWTELARGGPFGSGEQVEEWAIICIDNPTGDEGLDYSFSTGGTGYGRASYVAAYFTGGGGGSWSSIDGPQVDHYTPPYSWGTFIVTGVPEGAEAWVQFGICTAVYLANRGPYTNWSFGAGLGANPQCSPVEGAFTVMPHAPTADETVIEFEGIGAYGWPNTVSFAAYWTP